MDFDSAIAAHVAWKTKLRGAIAARTRLDVATIGKDDVCALGQWINGEARAKYGHLATFNGCKSAHAAFHREAGRIAALINAGEYADAEAALGAGTPYASASLATGVAMNKLRADIGA